MLILYNVYIPFHFEYCFISNRAFTRLVAYFFEVISLKNKKPWVLNQTWTKSFLISHILGWLLAWLQTFWIVYEIKKIKKRNDL